MNQLWLPSESEHYFSSIGPPITVEDITAVFPEEFTDRDRLITFYLKHNGGSRNAEGAVRSVGGRLATLSHDSPSQIGIDGFFAIWLNPEDSFPGVRSMLRYYRSRSQTFKEIPEITAFLSRHKPIAYGPPGYDYWIDTASGKVLSVTWESWQDGAAIVATCFSEFVNRYWRSQQPGHLNAADSSNIDGVTKFEKVSGTQYGTPEAVVYANKLRTRNKT